MTVYFRDSSALVKRYVMEQGTGWVNNLFDPAAKHEFYVAAITGAEVVSALARRARQVSSIASTILKLTVSRNIQ